MSARWRLFLTVVSLSLAAWILYDHSAKANLGLDLKGGTQVVLDLKPRGNQAVTSDTAERTLEVLRRRVDSLGVAEPNLEIAGEKRIIVELPGVTDPENAVNVIGSTAQLTFHRVQGQAAAQQQQQIPPTGAPAAGGATPTTAAQPAPGTTPTTAAGLGVQGEDGSKVLGQTQENPNTSAPAPTPTAPAPTPQDAAAQPTAPTASVNPDGSGTYPSDSGSMLQLGPSVLTGDGVETADGLPPDQTHTSWYIQLKFKGSGARAWTKLTGEAACAADGDPTRQVAIVLDNRIISAPQVGTDVQCNTGITGDTTEITGSFTQKDAKNLALLVRGGALPVDVNIASQQVIGPELGKDAIKASVNAVIIGGLLTLLFILIYYRFLGLLAGLALAAYSVLSYAVLLGLNLTLTLPGIAGFVLAIAMAMDSNVLVYERVKEEFANGRPMRQAGQMGFKNALSAIVDSNATTFLAALTLFFFAIGEVKGFGVTLLVGTAVSIFTTMVVLRSLVTGVLSMEWARNRPKMLGMYVGARFRKRMAENPPDLMGMTKYFLAASAVLTVIAVAGIGIKGINYGIEFTGGRLLEYKTANAVDLDKAREEMGALGFPRAVVQRSGTADTSIRVPELNKEQATKVADIMKNLGGGTAEILRDETIGPSFSKELKKKAVLALLIGLAVQLAYVGYRFRWTFGVGAVTAMIHDVLITLGIFAWLQRSFDAVFLAALLTIVAFSVNDSVVVFDRIREQRRKRASEPFARVVSDACAQTFPRTVNIGLSAIFILASLLFLGGQTLGDFALALLIGVVTGVYSSVMVASPIAVLLERWKPSMSAARSTSSQRKTKPVKTSVPDDAVAGDGADGEQESGATSVKTTTPRPAPRPRKKGKKRR